MKITRLTDPLAYQDGLALQDRTVAEILAGQSDETIFLLEHAPVYTIGRIRDRSSLRDSQSLPHPVFETNRGGQATFHGPGQLVGYPILDLNRRGRDLHEHLRRIEDALIAATADTGISASRRTGLTGVWTEHRKLASIGVGVRKWISMHGFAINITAASLPPFACITPCGLDGVSITSWETETGKTFSIDTAANFISRRLQEIF